MQQPNTMMSVFAGLSGKPPLEPEILTPKVVNAAVANVDEMVEEDFHTARENLGSLIKRGMDQLNMLEQVCDQSSHPQAYNALASLLKTLIDANQKLVEIHNQKKDTGAKDKPGNVTNNNTLIVTPAELQRLMTKMNGNPGTG